MRRIALALLTLAACTTPRDPSCRLVDTLQVPTNGGYSVHATRTTPAGTPLDDSGLGMTGSLYDEIIRTAQARIDANFPDHTLSPATIAAAGCQRAPGDPSITDPAHASDPPTLPRVFQPLSPSCVTLKIASDCSISETEYPAPPDPGHHRNQLLYVLSACDPAKPIPASGVCHPRAFVQDYTTVVTCPSGIEVADLWVRLVTGCNNPWGDARLAESAQPMPGLDPLGNGR